MSDFASGLRLPESTSVLEAHLANEIKVVKHTRDFALARAKVDEKYGRELNALNTKFGKLAVPEDYERAPIWKVWGQTLSTSEEYAQSVADNSGDAHDFVSKQLSPLIESKAAVKAEFSVMRKRVDDAVTQAAKELDAKEAQYIKAVKTMDAEILKFQTAHTKGKKGKSLDSCVERRYKRTNEAQNAHNKYVLALAKFNEVQEHAHKSTLPTLLSGLQGIQKHHVRDFQAAMVQFLEAMNHSAQPYRDMHQATIDAVAKLDGSAEYTAFLADYIAEDPEGLTTMPELATFEAADSVEEREPDTEQVNPLFYGTVAFFADVQKDLEHIIDDLEPQLELLKQDLEDRKQDLEEAKKDSGTIDDAKECTTTEDFTSREAQIDVQREVNAFAVEVDEIIARVKVTEQQLNLINEQVDKCNNDPPVYHDEDYFNDLVKGRSKPTPKGGGVRPTSSGGGARPKRAQLPPPPESYETWNPEDGPPPPRPLGGGGAAADSRVDPLSLEAQGYFHGKISRNEISPLLVDVGDYLVRESAKKPGELALSVRASVEKVTHFIIQQDVPGMFRFEGEAFDSVDDLINDYKDNLRTVTKRSTAKLVNAVNRHGFSEDGVTGKFVMNHRDVKLGKKLGNGNFGEVMLGTIVATGETVAIKTCKDTVPDPKRFLEEADTLTDYDHPNIVKLIGVVSTKPIMIILELCKDELLAHLRKHGSLIEVGQYCKMAAEAAAGMDYLHGKNCIHRDLAARNCLIGNDGAVKISDFGMSRMTEGEDDVYMVNTTAKQIPIKWTAPEALTKMTYVLATDVWAFGILLWEIFSCGKMPYPGMNNRECKNAVINDGYRMQAPEGTPDQVVQLMSECWQAKPEERPTMADIVDFLKEVLEFYPDEDLSV